MPSAPVIQQLGERLDLEVRRGATLGPFRHVIALDDEDETPFDLTGYQIRAVVRRNEFSTVVAEFNINTAGLAEGWYEFSLTDEQTAAFVTGARVSSSASRYKWDSEIETPAGDVIPVYYGELRVQPENTRP